MSQICLDSAQKFPSATDVVAQMKEATSPFILDMRTAEIPTNWMVIPVCRSGSRSVVAALQRKKFCYDVHNMTGGMIVGTGPIVRRIHTAKMRVG